MSLVLVRVPVLMFKLCASEWCACVMVWSIFFVCAPPHRDPADDAQMQSPKMHLCSSGYDLPVMMAIRVVVLPWNYRPDIWGT